VEEVAELLLAEWAEPEVMVLLFYPYPPPVMQEMPM
jgi:hypothetical protein